MQIAQELPLLGIFLEDAGIKNRRPPAAIVPLLFSSLIELSSVVPGIARATGRVLQIKVQLFGCVIDMHIVCAMREEPHGSRHTEQNHEHAHDVSIHHVAVYAFVAVTLVPLAFVTLRSYVLALKELGVVHVIVVDDTRTTLVHATLLILTVQLA